MQLSAIFAVLALGVASLLVPSTASASGPSVDTGDTGTGETGLGTLEPIASTAEYKDPEGGCGSDEEEEAAGLIAFGLLGLASMRRRRSA
jgi:MYXO-CTERM domain-containing protein